MYRVVELALVVGGDVGSTTVSPSISGERERLPQGRAIPASGGGHMSLE